ncbi:Diphtheria toxin repressor [Anaerolineales bacterium]|nr:Diphtheria toxin repressor [Anaerolineales bacterium]
MSESEEMYLVTLAMLAEAGTELPTPVSELANRLGIQPVSVNQMVRKLEETSLVVYTPYKGIALTPEGQSRALRILRHRRLWEVFLVENLRVLPDEADELACRLEHILPSDAAERLAGFLGNPMISPQRKPIPKLTANESLSSDILLSQLKINQQSQITKIDADSAVQNFLSTEGLKAGVTVTVIGIGNAGAILVSADGCSVYLAKNVANCIWVKDPDISHNREFVP